MAGENYMRLAQDNIQRAIMEKQTAVNDIRRQIDQLEADRKERVNQINLKITEHNVKIAHPVIRPWVNKRIYHPILPS